MRKALDIDRKCMTEIIERLEKENTYDTQTALFSAVSSEYHSARNLKVSPALVYLRVKEWGLTLKTQKGKKGGTIPVGQRERGLKLKSTKAQQSINYYRKVLSADKEGKKYMHLVDKMAKGSLKASLKLKCLDCGNFQTQEVKFCECYSCPLHAIRPYQ